MSELVNPLGGSSGGVILTVVSTTLNPPKVNIAPTAPKKEKPPEPEPVFPEVKEEDIQNVKTSLHRLTNIEFDVVQETGAFYFKIIDPETKEVLLQVPPEEIIRMSKNLRKISEPRKGLLLSKEG